MLRASRWMFVAVSLAGSSGCALYNEPDDGNGNPPEPDAAPPPQPPPDQTPQPLPPLSSSGFTLLDTADGGNASGAHGCDETYAHYEHSAAGGTQLHVVSIYQPAPDSQGFPSDSIVVRVTRPGSSVLLLTADQTTRWNIFVGPDSFVERVILISDDNPQSATVPEGTAIDSYARDRYFISLGDGYAWPGYESFNLVDMAQALTGLELTSFRGCRFSASFDIDIPVEIRPPHVVSDKVEPTLPAGCEAMASESKYCLSISEGKAAVIGLDSGTVCRSESAGPGDDVETGSIAWQGDYVYGCISQRGLARVSLVDGSRDIAPILCDAVTIYGDDLLLLSGGTIWPDQYARYSLTGLQRLDDFAAAARREVEDVVDILVDAWRLAVDGDRGYFAYYEAEIVQTAELRDGAELENILLEDYGPISGLAVTDGKLMILGFSPGLHLFDPTTGASLGVLAPEYTGDGLSCAGSL